ncbi:MAG: beta-N-acetylhexosaminidase [Nannocystaceae bacterium]
MPSIWQPGQLLFVGFAGTAAPPPLVEKIAQGRVGGVILFARNIESPEQVLRLCRDLHAAAPADAPLLIAIDQEGGRVQRLRDPFTVWPPMRRVGEHGDLEATAAVAEALAVELADYGIGLDFAPVVDVDTNPQNPVIGDRSFARDAAKVSDHARAFIQAMQKRGVAACAKHFPGHGDTTSDSHLELPRLEHDLDRLRAVELPPFAAAVAAEVATVMTAHVLFPRLDRKRPATLSPPIMAILREELAYDGFIFSDDLEMRAVADHFSVEQRTYGPLEAGVDGLLVCSDAGLADEVLRLLERAPDSLVEEGVRRLVALKQAYAGARRIGADHRPAGPPYAEHRALAERLR